ncbi:MAG: hypothetical protein ACLGI6_21030, partial [Gammaproteobacteria bacterium]
MRRIRFCLLSLLLGVPLAVVAPAARADAYLFDGSANPGCTLSGKVYSCGTLSLGATDSLAIASGYTVNVNSALTLGYNNAIVMSGTARLSVGGNLDVS